MIKSVIKKILWLLLICLIALMIWLKLPLKDSGVVLENKNHFLLASVDITEKNATLLNEIAEFKFKEEYVFKSKVSRLLLISGGRLLLPLKISIIAQPSEDSNEKFNYLVVIKSIGFRRFLELPLFLYRQTFGFKRDFAFSKRGDWQIIEAREAQEDMQVMACYADTIIISSSRNMFRSVVSQNVKTERRNQSKLLGILVNNEFGFFEYYVNEFKDKASYDIFRSADMLRKIDISMNACDKEYSHQGSMMFEFKAGCDLTSSKKDVRFFMQLIKRIMDANSYVFKYTLKENINKENINLVNVEYNLQKIRGED